MYCYVLCIYSIFIKIRRKNVMCNPELPDDNQSDASVGNAPTENL